MLEMCPTLSRDGCACKDGHVPAAADKLKQAEFNKHIYTYNNTHHFVWILKKIILCVVYSCFAYLYKHTHLLKNMLILIHSFVLFMTKRH